MANVLGELFQNIANAIRTKSGGTDSIKPADFANGILALNTSGGELDVKIKYGSYTGLTDSAVTVTHNMGVVPDFVFIYAYGINVADGGGITSAYGFSDSILQNAEFSEGDGKLKEFYKRILFFKSAEAAGNQVSGFVDENGIETSAAFGMIRNANAQTFTVGTSSAKHYDNTYYWFAVSFNN